GRMGAMVYGDPVREHLQFNENSLFTGHPHDYSNPEGGKALPEIQKLMFADKKREAAELITKSLLSIPVRQMSYQPFGDLYLDIPDKAEVSNYDRRLDMDAGLASVEYDAGGVHYRREYVASHPGESILVHLAADKPGSINAVVSLGCLQTRNGAEYTIAP